MIRLMVLTLGLMVIIGAGGNAEDDPIKMKLDAAIAKYNSDMAKFRTAAKESYDKREAAARKAGNKPLTEQIIAERKFFEDVGVLPPAAPLAIRKMPVTALSALEAAYAKAVADYTKVKKDAEAAALLKDLKDQRASGKLPQPWSFSYPPGKYTVTYEGNVSAKTVLRADGTFTRERDKVEATGTIEFVQGRIVLVSKDFVEAWANTGNNISVGHWFPATTFPNGKVQSTGEAVRTKE